MRFRHVHWLTVFSMIKCKFHLFVHKDGTVSGLLVNLPEGMLAVSSIIIDDYFGKDFLQFVDSVVNNVNEKDEYWTNGYTAKVVEKDGKKMIKIFFRLTDDYEPYYIDSKELKALLEMWIHEKEDFDQDPDAYKKELERLGGEKVVGVGE